MATHVSNISALHDDKLITPFSELAAKPQIKSDVLVRLATFLQTTLDYHQLLTIFQKEIATSVLIDGIRFQHDASNIDLTVGNDSPHNCHYELKTKDETLGSMTFSRATRFREHELANIEALMGTLVYPLRNALRYHLALEQAFKDPLTGAGNRLALRDNLSRDLELAKRHEYELSLLMLDLDYFKPINDEFGHLVGDEVLKLVVSKTKECIRQTDMCFRYGGEEFIVLLNNAHIANARFIAERIRMAIEDISLTTDQGKITPTISVGLAMLTDSDSINSLICRADKALYKAKDNGRNQVSVIENEDGVTT